MKVSVYILEDGKQMVLVQATPGKGRPPVLLQGITKENLVGQVLPLVEQMRRPKGEQMELFS